jgi:NitT/TauT family transport system permease protein
MTHRLARLAPAIFLLIVAGVWELASRSGFVDVRLLPPLSEVLPVLGRLLESANFRADLGLTALEVLVSFIIVVPLGIGVGLYLGEQPKAYALFGPTLNLLLSVPKSIFLPVFIFAFGIGFGQKVVYAVTLAFFIVVLTGIARISVMVGGKPNSFGVRFTDVYANQGGTWRMVTWQSTKLPE